MFDNARDILIEWLNSKGAGIDPCRGAISEIALTMRSSLVDAALNGGRLPDDMAANLSQAVTQLLRATDTAPYAPLTRRKGARESRLFWESTEAGQLISAAQWVAYAGDMITPATAAEILFADREQTIQAAAGSVAHYAVKGWITAYYRPGVMYAVQLSNPNGAAYTGGWAVRRSECLERLALQPRS